MPLHYFADIIAPLLPTIALIQNPRTFALCVLTACPTPIRSTLSALAYSVILVLDSITDYWLSTVVHTLLAIYDLRLEYHATETL